MILNRASTFWLVAAQATINLVAGFYSVLTGTPLDAALLLNLNGFAAAMIALVAGVQNPPTILRR